MTVGADDTTPSSEEGFSSHFDFGTLDMGVFNKYGSDSTGAIAIFLWGSSHGTPTFWL